MPAPATPFVVTVDTEEEWDWSSGYPTGPARTENIHRLPAFQETCEGHGAAVTYFVNHAVIADSAARRIVLDLAERPRVEIGMHVHPWNTPPLQPVERVPMRESFIHNLPPDLARAKLDTVYETFAACGLKPVSFRGGRYSTGPLVQEWLRERGFVADASVLPYSHWTDAGAPDYRTRDPQPVRVAGETPLWEVPLSLGYTRRPFRFWRRALAAAASAPLRSLRLVGLLSKLGVVEQAWLNFENPLGEKMSVLIRTLRRMNMPYLCFTLHSSSLLPGGSPYAPNPAAVDRVFYTVANTLERFAADPGLCPATVAEIARRLEAERHARDRDQPVG
jgi:uncharacterized protein YjeT (DUF2065 family)